MEPSHAGSISAARSACALRQMRRDRQANRAIWALLGFSILSVMLAKFTALLVAGAAADQREQLARISAALQKPDASVCCYVIEPPDILRVEVAAEAAANVAGEHLVASDGTIDLGDFGSAHVAGLTVSEAKLAIENQLKDCIDAPEVSVGIHAFNSKVYYVIIQRPGSGDSLIRVPITGNETLLDALAQVNCLSRLSSKSIWIARPLPGGVNGDQILPVNWHEITTGVSATSNYAILSGDRLFVADKMIALDTWIDWFTNPMERIFGFGLIGVQTNQSLGSTCGVTGT